jgi:hypothetical protein
MIPGPGRSAGWAVGLGLLAIASLGPPGGAAQWQSRPFAPCVVIGASQLSYVVSGGVARYFPLRMAEPGGAATVSAPRGSVPHCPGGTVELEAAVGTSGRPGDSATAAGVVRLTLDLGGTATLVARGDSAPKAKDLKSAVACVRAVRVESLSLDHGPAWLDNRWLAGRLGEHLVRRACFDVTSLVYVYLTRGGRL